MKALHRNLQIKEFEQPSGVETHKYCTATGELATEACPKTDTGVYKTTNKPGVCSAHSGAAAANPTTTVPSTTTTTATEEPTTTAPQTESSEPTEDGQEPATQTE